MPRVISLACPRCGHQWQEDLDRHQAEQVIYRGENVQKVREESYRFRCPLDGTTVVAEVTVEA